MIQIKNNPVWFDDVPETLRFQPLEGSREAEILILGGGMAGIMTAWQLQDHGSGVILLEKNRLATGDTGLTTGFLTRVPDVSAAFLEERYGSDFLKDLFSATRRVQEELFDVIERNNIACDFKRCESYYGTYDPADHVWEKERKSIEKAQVPLREDHPFPFRKAIRIFQEGSFHSRKFALDIAKILNNKGIQIFEDSEALDVDVQAEGVRVRTTKGIVHAKKLLVAIGNPSSLFPELASIVNPKLSYVVAAKYNDLPISTNLYWDTLDPYFYFRSIDPHTLIVGGADILYEKAKEQKPYEIITKFLQERIGAGFEMTHQWSGSLFDTEDGLPYVFEHPNFSGKVFVATGFGGNGLIFGAFAAKVFSHLIRGAEEGYERLLALSRTRTQVAAPIFKTKENTEGQKFVSFAQTSDFGEKRMIGKTVDGQPIVVFKIGNNFRALRNVCTHAGGTLSEGMLQGNVITCPLHAAQFDIETGNVLAPPASRPVETYKTRVRGGNIEVEIGVTEGGVLEPQPFATLRQHWKALFRFSLAAWSFWFVEFVLQYFWLTKGELTGSLVRSFALSGATLISGALFSSAIFKWFPPTAQYWRLRRYLGVSGFVFIFFHVLSVYALLFDFDFGSIYYSLNPIENPIIFGSFAFPILMAMALTSTDWAVQKLTPRRWKFLHRFVYVAYLASVFHFITINPQLLKNPPGYLLLLLTVLALSGQLFWFMRTASKKHFRSLGSLVGLLIILGTTVLGYIVYREKFSSREIVIPQEELPLEEAVDQMKEFMKKSPDAMSNASTAPIADDEIFSEGSLRRGIFQNLNYMSSGSAFLAAQDGSYFAVFDSDFETPNGPDLKVYLTKNSGSTEREDILEGVLLGDLKSLKGKQTYVIPEDISIDEFHSITIHCQAFNVPWSYVLLK